MKGKLWAVILIAVALRVIPALFGVITADIKFHLAYVMQFVHSPGSSLYLYGAIKALYHNTPIWLFVETLTLFAATKLSISFAVLVKLWPILADTGIILLLYRMEGGTHFAWLYALNPVSILITGFHGQFDPVVMFFMLAAILLAMRGTKKREFFAASLLLGIGIALKGFPILLLPFFLRNP